jgi:protein-disulfide isomerase
MAQQTGKWRQRLGWVLAALLLTGAGGAWYALDLGFQSARAETDAAADEFGQRVREYLLAHPEVIVEAMQVFEARRLQDEEDEARAVLAARADEVFRDPDSPVGGNAKGDVTMVEFFDYNCPYCRQVASVVADAEAGDAGLRIVYKEFPILGPGSVFAARAALAANRQGRYAAFHKALMDAKGRVDETSTLSVAKEIGLDVERLKQDMQDPAIQAEIDGNLELAEALRITGTPGFVIGDNFVRGATDLEAMTGLIEAARSEKATGPRAIEKAD